MEFTQPPINELPYVNQSFFNILFKALPVELIVTIFTHLLVERSVSFYLINTTLRSLSSSNVNLYIDLDSVS